MESLCPTNPNTGCRPTGGAESCRKPRFPAGGKQDFRVYFDRGPCRASPPTPRKSSRWKSAACWWATGIATPDGPFVLSTRPSAADNAVSHAGDVTFTHEAWNDVNREMDTDSPTARSSAGTIRTPISASSFPTATASSRSISSPTAGPDCLRGRSGPAWRGFSAGASGKSKLCRISGSATRSISIGSKESPALVGGGRGRTAGRPRPARRNAEPLLSPLSSISP